MKKLLSLMLAVTMLLSMITAVSVSAEVSTIWDDTDNTSPYAVSKYASAEGNPDKVRNTTKFANDPTMQNVLQVSKSASGTAYPRVAVDLPAGDYIYTDSTATTSYGNNAYAEIEYDLNISELVNSDGTLATFSVFLIDNAKNAEGVNTRGRVSSIRITENNRIQYNYINGSIYNWVDGVKIDRDKTNRFKFVLKLTDENGAPVQKVEGIYLNGVNLLSEPIDFANMNSSGTAVTTNKITRVYFECGSIKNCPTASYYIDNMKISRYSTSDTSKPAEKGALVAAIRHAQMVYSQAIQRYGAESAVVASLKTKLDNAVALNNSATAAQTDINTTAADLASWQSTEVTTLWNDTDNAVPYAASKYASAEGNPDKVRNTTKFANDITLQNVLQVSKGTASGASNYPRVAADLSSSDYIYTDSRATTEYGKNAYAEFEYDLNISELVKESGTLLPFAVYLVDSNTKGRVTSIRITENNRIQYNYISGSIYNWVDAVKIDRDKTNRFKFVLKLTDENGAPVQKVEGIYLNGVNLLSEPVDFANMNSSGAATTTSIISRLYFECPTVKDCVTASYYIDNVKISRYSKLDPNEPSPIEDNGKLVSALRTKYAEVAKVTANTEKYASVVDAVTASKTALEAKYNGGDADINTLLLTADSITAQIKAIDEMPKIVSITKADDKITGVVIEKNANYTYDGTVLVAIYSGTTVKEVVGAAVADNVFVDQATGEITVTFNAPIAIPTGDNLSVKAMLWNDLDNADGIDVLEESI